MSCHNCNCHHCQAEHARRAEEKRRNHANMSKEEKVEYMKRNFELMRHQCEAQKALQDWREKQ